MQSDDDTGEDSPEQKRQATDSVQNDAENDIAGPVVLGQPDVNFIVGEVGNVTRQCRGVVVHRLAREDPAHVRPPFAIDRRMGVALLVRKLMMNAVRRYPENRAALERQRGTPGEEIFHPLRRLISAMRQQPVIAHADAKAAGNPPKKNGYEERLPGKEKERRNGARMKQDHGGSRAPIEAVTIGTVFTQASSAVHCLQGFANCLAHQPSPHIGDPECLYDNSKGERHLSVILL